MRRRHAAPADCPTDPVPSRMGLLGAYVRVARHRGCLQRRERAGRGACLRRRGAQGPWPRAQRASLTDSSRLSERRERSERSEFRDGPRTRAPQGSRAPRARPPQPSAVACPLAPLPLDSSHARNNANGRSGPQAAIPFSPPARKVAPGRGFPCGRLTPAADTQSAAASTPCAPDTSRKTAPRQWRTARPSARAVPTAPS